tara:strand:- start:1671 stop:2267 length:597 start_codon:yes stop_codon:yes gene_type:complete
MDINYWENYYTKIQKPFDSSSFAKFVLNKINPNQTIIDLGCGNGRDSIFFSDNKIQTLGVDQSSVAIKNLKKYENSYLNFEISDFSNLKKEQFDYGYCRFILHSINEVEEENLINWLSKNITKNIFIESRTNIDEKKYKKTNHYRRLMNIDSFKKSLEKKGFKIEYEEVSDKFSKYSSAYKVSDINFDPIIVRFVLSL